MTIESMLTTIDNPYSPFDEYENWYAWDNQAGYNTPGFLARLSSFSLDLSEVDQSLELERVIDEIVRENVLGLYVKVTKEIEDKEQLVDVED